MTEADSNKQTGEEMPKREGTQAPWKKIVLGVLWLLCTVFAWRMVARPIFLPLAGAILLAAWIAITDEGAAMGREFRPSEAFLKASLSIQWGIAAFFLEIVYAPPVSLPSKLSAWAWVAMLIVVPIALVSTFTLQKYRQFAPKMTTVLIIGALIFGLAVTYSGVIEIESPADIADVSTVVQDAAKYEMLTVYERPTEFDRNHLRQFYQEGSQAFREIEDAVQREVKEHRHYGEESKGTVEIFRVHIFGPGNYAEVETHERWSVPSYRVDGSLMKDRTAAFVFCIDYKLRKNGGRWLIEWTSAPYVH